MVFVKGSSVPSHFIFEINVGTWRIRQRTTPNLNDVNLTIDFESIWKFIIQCKGRSMSDPSLSDIVFKNKIAWV